LSIATKGVLFDPSGASNVAFLPAYPALTALVDLVIRNVGASSLLVSNIAFVAGVFVFRRWMQNRVGLGAADRSTVCLILYPLSFFFDTGYAESLFFLLCTLALERADREDWTAAGICASLATLTRPHGILLLPAFAYGFARGRRTAGVPWSALAALAMPIAALAAYFVYLWIAVGTPLAVIEAQRAGWHVRPSWYFMEWHAAKHVVGAVLNVFQLVLPVPLAALSLLAWRKLGPLAGVYSVLAVTAAVVFGADSLGREALAVVPVFAAAGLVQLPRPVLAACGVAGFALLVTFTYAFAMGQFMG
jgi:Gpi18-like mannosyltransferase